MNPKKKFSFFVFISTVPETREKLKLLIYEKYSSDKFMAQINSQIICIPED